MSKVIKIEAKNQEKKKLRVAAYARVSTGSDEQLQSLDAQKKHYKKLIKIHDDWEYAGMYYDEGISGTRIDKRLGFQRMIDECEKGNIDYIITKSISRFARNALDSIQTVRLLLEKGISIFFEKENIDTGKMDGELMLSLLSSLAENESHSIAENLKWGIKKRMITGKFAGTLCPYGYVRENSDIIIVPQEAEIVRKIFEQSLKGLTPNEIAKYLNAEGIKTRKGNEWSDATIRGMIRNRIYTGDLVLQKTYTDDKFKKHINRGEREQIFIADHHEGIVSLEQFEKANALIDFFGREKGIIQNTNKYIKKYAFTNKLICGKCGNNYVRKIIMNKVGYACRLHIKEKEKCDMLSVKHENLEIAFINMINKLQFSKKKMLLPYYETIKVPKNYDKELENVQKELETIYEKKCKLNENFLNGLIEDNICKEINEELRLEEEIIINKNLSIHKEKESMVKIIEALKKMIKYLEYKKMIEEFDEYFFNEFVEKIIIVNRNEVCFELKCGLSLTERM